MPASASSKMSVGNSIACAVSDLMESMMRLISPPDAALCSGRKCPLIRNVMTPAFRAMLAYNLLIALFLVYLFEVGHLGGRKLGGLVRSERFEHRPRRAQSRLRISSILRGSNRSGWR